MPDRVYTTSSSQLVDQSSTPLSEASNNGAWYYDNSTNEFSYIGMNSILLMIFLVITLSIF